MKHIRDYTLAARRSILSAAPPFRLNRAAPTSILGHLLAHAVLGDVRLLILGHQTVGKADSISIGLVV